MDFDNNMKNLDTTIVDEIKLKDEIYEEFRPILDKLENDKPSINLQWVFNWVYRDRIKQILYKRTNLIYRRFFSLCISDKYNKVKNWIKKWF